MNDEKPIGRRALKPDAQGFDEIRIITVPRWKDSYYSGSEWRISASIQFFRKGVQRHEVGVSKVETAAGFCYAEMMRAYDSALGYFAGEEDTCDQEGCALPARHIRWLKKEFCQAGHGEDVKSPVYRMFCDDHKRRGDCGLEDNDSNYSETPVGEA